MGAQIWRWTQINNFVNSQYFRVVSTTNPLFFSITVFKPCHYLSN
jgi:hypothetical protein